MSDSYHPCCKKEITFPHALIEKVLPTEAQRATITLSYGKHIHLYGIGIRSALGAVGACVLFSLNVIHVYKRAQTEKKSCIKNNFLEFRASRNI